MQPISVVIPVGPYEANLRWMDECMQSVREQTVQPKQIVIVDDGSGYNFQAQYNAAASYGLRVLYLYWRTGISHSFNYGIMAAPTDLVFMLGSDDTLEPNCLERCVQAYEANNQEDAYYSVPIKYMDTSEVQTAPCNAAMVTKGFWRLSGGFPIETAIGIGDSTLLSICMAHSKELPVQWVGHLTGHDDEPLYNYRRHPDIHTYKLGGLWHIIDPLRGYLTEHWSKDAVAEWSGRY